MPYLVAADLPSEPAGKRFRALVGRGGILQLPGAHNGMAALQAKAAGFEALYLSGAAMSASMGLPDLGIITVEDVTFFVRQIVRASGLPVLVDGDTGYGEALNVMHMVRAFEDAGAGAVQIEDQLLPKKCGHLNNKKLADAHDMAAKIAAAHRARRHRGHRGAREALCAGRRGCDLSGGDDFRRDVCRGRAATARRAAAGEHDRVRPHALHHGCRIREDGIPHGDLARLLASGGEQGPGRALSRTQAQRRHAQFTRSDADPRRTLRPDRPEGVRGAGCLDRRDGAAGAGEVGCRYGASQLAHVLHAASPYLIPRRLRPPYPKQLVDEGAYLGRQVPARRINSADGWPV